MRKQAEIERQREKQRRIEREREEQRIKALEQKEVQIVLSMIFTVYEVSLSMIFFR